MRKWHSSTLLISFFFLVAWLTPTLVHAAGPWKAQVVDAETGKPLVGVVVLAYWLKYTESLVATGGAEFYDSEEVVTGPDGRFVIQARSTWTLNPFRRIGGMELVIFKPGYGRWRFRGSKDWPEDLYEQKARVKKAWEQFEGEGVVIELPPLRTRKERLEFYQSPGRTPPGIVPAERMRRFEEAENAERAYLGFRN